MVIIMPKICEECGEEIKNENAKFCDKCGAKIKITPKVEDKKNNSNIKSMDKNKLMIAGAIIIIAIVAVVGFTLFNQPEPIECKTVDITNGITMDVPINSTHEKKNTLDYYKSDLADIMVFVPSAEKVDKKTQDELTGMYVHELVYEDPSVQKDAEIISGKMYDATHYDEKATIDDVFMWHDETSGLYSLVLDGGSSGGYCIYAESKDPHVLAQIYKSMHDEDSK